MANANEINAPSAQTDGTATGWHIAYGVLLIIVGILAVAMPGVAALATALVFGWLLIHTLFVLRYAHLYYQHRDEDDKNGGGLAFPGTHDPKDLDFAYFSFVLGMTFQVSDVQVTSPHIRALALVHGLISFGYNTAILALVVNTVAGLLH